MKNPRARGRPGCLLIADAAGEGISRLFRTCAANQVQGNWSPDLWVLLAWVLFLIFVVFPRDGSAM